jgi:LuxR family transcriptional regulator, maltose regulon positive regulatory protein
MTLSIEAPHHVLPPSSAGLVPRERLVRRLLGAAAVPIVLAVAPAGYGKTTTLTQWAENDRRQFGWIALREIHNDPARLLADIALELDGAGHEFVLVLDDFHALTDPRSLETVRTTAEHLPEGTQLVLAARQEPRLPIGRLRANRMICELGWRDFAMTTGEAAALLQLTGLQVDVDDVAVLMQRTEGWPAGLYLAALSLLDQPQLKAALPRFGGDDRIVADYVRDESLSQLTPEQSSFVTRTSVLKTLSGGLCDAVLDRRGSAQVLNDLARSNLLIPLDRTEERYRYHHLVAGVLKAALRRDEPETEAHVHRQASSWYANHGDIELAIDHAVAGRDVERAGALLWSRAATDVLQGRNAAVRRWLDQFASDEIAQHPFLALTAAASDLVAGRRDWVECWASAAARRVDAAASDESAAGIAAGVAIMRAAIAREGIPSMEASAARAYAAEPDESPWRSVCCLLIGVAAHLMGNRGRATERLEEGARRAVVDAPGIRGLCLAQLALLALEQDDWAEAVALADRARIQLGQAELADYPTSGLVFAVSALVRAQRGRVDDAQQDMKQAMRLLARLGDFAPWYEVEMRITLALAAVRLSDVVGARRLLTQASRALRRTPEAVVLDAWLQDAWAQADQFIAASVVAPTTLTTAELRVLRLLPTHLSFREIGNRLHVSANTIKSQAHAVYRKLDASSRSDAVTHARAMGLLDA